MAPPRKPKGPRPRLGDPARPRDMATLADEFVEAMAIRAYSANTTSRHYENLARFITWCAERGISTADDVNKRVVERYQRHVFYYRKRNGQPLATSTQRARLVAVRVFFRWLVRTDRLPSNPAADFELPKKGLRLPQHILNESEVERVVALCDMNDPLGVRDRAMIETLYSTGMRRMELANLNAHDVDHQRGTVMIRQGKGNKDRMIPIGERACLFIARYLDDGRQHLVIEPDDGTLFLTATGERFDLASLSRLVSTYVRRADLGKQGSCHLFRHTMATMMLEGGADIRFIQAMLGHARLDATEVYTQVALRKLKEIHSATHPAAKLERRPRPPEAGESDAE